MKKNFTNNFTYILYYRKAKMIFIMAIGTTFFLYKHAYEWYSFYHRSVSKIKHLSALES